MKFLDGKEQVLDIELTQYGKHLLSRGLWNPEYYEFFDDDILYDGEWASSFDANQNSIQQRIKEIPRLEAQYVWEGIETNIKKNNLYIRQGGRNEDGDWNRIQEEIVQSTPEKNFSTSAPLGTSDPQSEYRPAWDMKIYSGEISSSSTTLQEENYSNSKIPQIMMKNPTYKVIVKSGEPSFSSPGEEPLPAEFTIIEENRVRGGISRPMPDGTYVDIQEDFILVSLEEINASLGDDDLSVEIYEVKEEQDRRDYIPLFFEPKKIEIKDDLLLDVAENELNEIDPTYSSYFFDIFTDGEIPDDILCLLPEEIRNQYGVSCDFLKENEDLYDQGTKKEEDC